MSPQDKTSETTGQNGYKEDTAAAYDAWKDFYQRMSDDSMAMLRQGMETAQRMSPFYPGGEIFIHWMDNYRDFVSRIAEEVKVGEPDSFRRYYDAWIDTWTRNLEAYMQTPEFAAKSGRHLETMSEVTQKMGEFMEAYWHAIHLPSSQDMKEIYHKLYVIERKLDELDKRVRMSESSTKSAASAKKSKKITL